MAHMTASIDVVAGEIVPLTINADTALGQGETATISALVKEETSRQVIADAIVGTPQLTGDVVSLTLDARKLAPYNRYSLITFLTISPGAKIIGIVTPLICDH